MNDPTFQKSLQLQLKQILAYLIKIGAPREDAEDIVQETAIKYIENIESIPPATAKSWLFKVAINRFYDLIRSDSTKRKALVHIQQLDVGEADSPEKHLLAQELRKEIMTILNKMTSNQRDFLILKYIFQLRYQDIASLYNLHEGTVKTTIFRAKKTFINLYEVEQHEGKK